MNRAFLPLLAAAALLLLAATLDVTPLQAQEEAIDRPARQGFWASVGVGAGDSRINCRQCGPDRAPGDPWYGGRGGSGYLAAGAALRPNLLIGGEFNLWSRRLEARGTDATLGLLSFVTQYYPLPNSPVGNLYGKAGLGAGLSVLSGGDGKIEGGGWGVQLGAGYDIFLGGRLALSPFANFVQILAPGAAGENQGSFVVGPRNPRYVQFGLGLAWY
jgi:hypothetical protein